MNQQEEVSRQVHQMHTYLSDVARSTDGPGASKPGTHNFEKRASAHRYLKSEAQRIMSQFPHSAWVHEQNYLEMWATSDGYRG